MAELLLRLSATAWRRIWSAELHTYSRNRQVVRIAYRLLYNPPPPKECFW